MLLSIAVMSVLYISYVCIIYFFIPIIIGIFIYGLGGRYFGLFLIVVGALCSLRGVPYWYGKHEAKKHAQAYFENICREKAVIEKPNTTVLADGVVWIDPDAARSWLSGSDNYRDFLGVTRGRYRAVEIKFKNSATISSNRVDLERGEFDGGRFEVIGGDIPQATLPFEVYTHSVTTNEDRKHYVDGIETTITDSGTRHVVARRVVYAKYPLESSQGTWGKPVAVCPGGAVPDQDCDLNGCSVLPFILSVVKPTLQTSDVRGFDLYRGIGKKQAICSFSLNIGPGLSPKDIEWWADGPNESESLNFRIKGSEDHIYCNGFFWGGNSLFPKIRFIDSGRDFSSAVLFNMPQKPKRDSPSSLAETLDQAAKLGPGVYVEPGPPSPENK